MSQPLGDAVGNALDIVETVELLRGEHQGRLRQLAVALRRPSARGQLDIGVGRCARRAERAIDTGEALERFRRMVQAQGGDPARRGRPRRRCCPRRRWCEPLLADRTGVVATIDAEMIGSASVALGAGRIRQGRPDRPRGGYRGAGQDRSARIRGGADRRGPCPAIGHGRRASGIANPGGADRVATVTVDVPPLVHGWFGERIRGGAHDRGREDGRGGCGSGVHRARHPPRRLHADLPRDRHDRSRVRPRLDRDASATTRRPGCGDASRSARRRGSNPSAAGLVPVLLAILWVGGRTMIPAAYAKPAPVDPSSFRKTTRETVLVSLAGPLATLVLGVLGGPAGAGRHLAAGRGVPVRTGADVHEHVAGGLPSAADPGTGRRPIVALLLPPAGP